MADEILRELEKDLVVSAAQSARDRIKGTFILLRIAEKEKIGVTEMDMRRRIAQLAQRSKMTFDKMLKELQKRGVIDQIREELITAKTLDFIASQASVTVEGASAESPAPAAEPAKE